MGAFVERYRYVIGAVLLCFILVGATFLLWREDKWKPALDKRIDAIQTEIEQLKTTSVVASDATSVSDTVDPSELIAQSQGTEVSQTPTTPAPKVSTPKALTSSKVAGASTKQSITAVSNNSTTTSQSSDTSTTKTAKPTPTECSSSAAKPALPASPININIATCYQLMALPGVGATTAQNIVDYRTAHGAFTSIEQLDSVKNIGPSTLGKIRAHVTVN